MMRALCYEFPMIFVSVPGRAAACLCGNALVSIIEVSLRRAGLVLGWVTVCGWVNHLGMQPATWVNSAWPSLRG